MIAATLPVMLAASLLLVSLGAVALPQEAPKKTEAPPPDPLAAARTAWAHTFMNGPAPTLELARLHRDQGREELAVMICEGARHRFGDEKFDEAFARVFAIQPEPEPSPELAAEIERIQGLAGADEPDVTWHTAVDEALKKFPDACQLRFLRIRAMESRRESARDAWDAELKRTPRSALILAWAGRNRWVEGKDRDAALVLCQRAYLLDPHVYETEFVELRIKELGEERSFAIYSRCKEQGDFRKALTLDAYWGVERAVQKLRKDWKPEYVADAVRMLAHDAVEIRWNALEVLEEHADDVSDAVLDALLADQDLRVRGLAIYVAVKQRREQAFAKAKEFLASDVQLLRFDAICALRRHGGLAGTKIVDEYAPSEKDPELARMLERAGRR